MLENLKTIYYYPQKQPFKYRELKTYQVIESAMVLSHL
ncbi:hypothetical protein HMPREF9714_01422 [Myroides odoratimimus CCUG 12901]|nr:hypothetical protein HMPREF9714_01422 [Myroides odoratimimus CCUG 12901]